MSVCFWIPSDDEYGTFCTLNGPSAGRRAPASVNNAAPARATGGDGDGGGFKYLPNTDE